MSEQLKVRSSDSIRITSVPLDRAKYVICRGVPIDSKHMTKSARYCVSVSIDTESIQLRPEPGQLWRVSGERSIHKLDNGRTVIDDHTYKSPDLFECFLPNTGESFIQFIKSQKDFKGIGEGKARELWREFGEGIHDILLSSGGEHLPKLREFLTDKSIKNLFEGYRKYSNLEHSAWMTRAGIPNRIQQRIFKHHKLGTIEAIQCNPYQLIYFGMSFKEIDQLLKKIEGNVWSGSYSDERIEAAAIEGLNKCTEDGSTYVKPSQVQTKIFNLLKDYKNTDQAIELLKTKPSIAIYNPEEDRLHPLATAIQELAVAKRIKALSKIHVPIDSKAEKHLKDVLSELPYELTEQQISAIRQSIASGVSCVTGGAGTGKTTVLSSLLNTFSRMGYVIHAVALSGRAAMRLHESIGYVTMTIARFLREEPVISDKCKHVLVIDEASMIDLSTMYKLINHIDPNVRIIFTGDPNQLPPIGAGKILHDLVTSGVVPNSSLSIVKRQEGSTGIPEYSRLVNTGVVPEDLSTGNIYFHETSKENFQEVVLALYGLEPENTRIIAPTRELVSRSNESIQSQYNRDGEVMNFGLNSESYYLNLRQGDQVLFTQNHYQAGVQNGSLGTLLSVEQTDSSFGSVQLDTGEIIEIDETLLNAIDLGYAITLHKAQGSQFKRIVVVLAEGRIVDRSWLYTAITRAETEVHIIGNSSTFEKVTIEPAKAFKRKTMLSSLLKHID